MYQVNCKGLQPYYTGEYLDALHVWANLRLIGLRCSMRRIRFDKVLYKLGYIKNFK